MNQALIFFSLLFFVPHSFAQSSYLQKMITLSKSEVKRYEHEIDTLKKNTADKDYPCKALQAQFKRNYFSWFLAHQNDFQVIETSLEQVIQETNQKLELLRKTTLQMVPSKTDHQTSIPVNLDSLIKYVNTYNKLQATCGKEHSKSLQKVMNDPELKPTELSTDQAKNLISMMLEVLNASLKETSTDFSLGLKETTCGYDLVFNINASKIDYNLSQSLINKNNTHLNLTQENLWKMILAQSQRAINGMSLDGFIRFLQMHGEHLEEECRLDLWVKTGRLSTIKPSGILVTFEEANEFAKKLGQEEERRIKLENLRGTSYPKSTKITYQKMNCDQGFEIFVNGDPILNGSCFNKPAKLFTIGNLVYILMIDPFGNLFFSERYDFRFEIASGVTQIISAQSNSNGIPSVTYKNNDKKIMESDLVQRSHTRLHRR